MIMDGTSLPSHPIPFGYIKTILAMSLVNTVYYSAEAQYSLTTTHTLPSADMQTLVVGRTQSSFADRTFAAAAPRLWNSLLSDVRQPDLSNGQFRWLLKTFLFVL